MPARLRPLLARVPSWVWPVAGFSAAGLALATLAVWRLWAYVPDDAFITYRFAQNIAEGHGWTYNPGEQTGNGATSPLYTLILAAGALVHPDVRRLGTFVFILGTAVAVVCTALLLRDAGQRTAAVLSAPFIALNPWLASTRGMESGLFLGLASATVLAFLRGGLFVSGLLAGLLTLVRGEGVLLAALLGALALRQDRRVPWRFVLGGLSVGVPWLVYSAVALGSVVPDTLAAKVAQGASGYWGQGWVFFTQWTPVLRGRPTLQAWGWLLVALAALGAVALVLHRLRSLAIGVLLAFTGLFLLAYGVVLDVPGYHWYYALPVYALSMLAAVGVGHVWDTGLAGRDALRTTVALGAALALVGLGWAGFLRGWNGVDYVHLGEFVRGVSEPDDRVAATEIGYIGWASGRPVVDYLGLLSPQSAEELAAGDLETWVHREQPDFWIRYDPPLPVEEQVSMRVWFPYAFELIHERSGIGVYRATRSIEAATRAAVDALRAEAATLLAQLPPGSTAAGDDDALAAALAALAERRDLHALFVGDAVDLAGLVAWAAGAPADDQHADLLASHRARLRSLAGLRWPSPPAEELSVLRRPLSVYWRTGEWPKQTPVAP